MVIHQISFTGLSKVIMPSSPPPYLSYLLRLWLAGDNDLPEWRAALLDPLTGERRGFASLEEMTIYLQGKMAEYIRGDSRSAWDATRFRGDAEEGEITD
jgi:hypothetical protein